MMSARIVSTSDGNQREKRRPKSADVSKIKQRKFLRPKQNQNTKEE